MKFSLSIVCFCISILLLAQKDASFNGVLTINETLDRQTLLGSEIDLTKDHKMVLVYGQKPTRLFNVQQKKMIRSFDAKGIAFFSENESYIYAKHNAQKYILYDAFSGEQKYVHELKSKRTEILSLVDHPTKKWFAYTTSDKKLVVFNFLNNNEVLSFTDFNCKLNERQLHFSADGKFLATTLSRCNEMVFFDLETKENWSLPKIPEGYIIDEFTFDKANKYVYVLSEGGNKNHLIKYDYTQKKIIDQFEFEGTRFSAKHISYHPKKNQIYINTSHRNVAVVSLDEKKLLALNPNPPYSPFLVIGDDIIDWDTPKQPHETLNTDLDYLRALRFNQDGNYILMCSQMGIVKTINLQEGTVTYYGKSIIEPNSIGMSLNNNYIAQGGSGGQFVLIDVSSKKELFRYKDFVKETTYAVEIDFSDDEKYLAVKMGMGKSGYVVVSIPDGKVIRKVYWNSSRGDRSNVTEEILVDDPINSTDKKFLEKWTTDGEGSSFSIHKIMSSETYRKYAMNDKYLILYSSNNKMRRLKGVDIKNQKPFYETPINRMPKNFAVNEKHLALVSKDKVEMVEFGKGSNGKVYPLSTISSNYFDYCDISNDSKYLLLGNHQDNALMVYDIEKGEEIFRTRFYTNRRLKGWVATNPDGQFSVSNIPIVSENLHVVNGTFIKKVDMANVNKYLLKIR